MSFLHARSVSDHCGPAFRVQYSAKKAQSELNFMDFCLNQLTLDIFKVQMNMFQNRYV